MAKITKLPNGVIAALGAVGAFTAITTSSLIAYRRKIRTTCREFYGNAQRQMVMPGLKDGFDPQDLFYVESADTWLFSGYNVDRKNCDVSPVYKVDGDGNVSKLTIELPGGLVYKGHGAAICATDEYAFLTVKDGYVVMKLSSVLEASDGDTIHAFAHVPVELEPAFMNIQDGVLYIGEFYHKRFYETPQSHWIECPNGTFNPALMYAYDPSDDPDALFGFASRPNRVYSIPGEIQGMCVMPDRRIVMSRSWGYGDSEMLVYEAGTAIVDDAQTASFRGAGAQDEGDRAETARTYLVAGEEVPLYYLSADNLEKSIALPPMSEGIDAHDGQVWIANESASNLYALGKINGGKYVYSIPV